MDKAEILQRIDELCYVDPNGKGGGPVYQSVAESCPDGISPAEITRETAEFAKKNIAIFRDNTTLDELDAWVLRIARLFRRIDELCYLDPDGKGGGPVYRFLEKLCWGNISATEITRQTCEAAKQKILTHHVDGKLDAWVLGIARNKVNAAIDALCRKYVPPRKEQLMGDGMEQFPAKENDKGCRGPWYDALEDCLEKLKEKDRESSQILRAYYWWKYSVFEITTVLGKSEDAVRARMKRAREWLRDCILRKIAQNPASFPFFHRGDNNGNCQPV